MAGAVLGIARDASAQIPFQITAQTATSTQLVANGTNINLVANSVGQSLQLTLTVTYTGSGTASLSSAQLFGSSSFALTGSGSGSLGPGQATTYQVTYTPTSGTQTSASLSIPFTQTVGTAVSSGSITLSFTGLSSQFILGYAIQPQGNAIPLTSGGTLTFPPTAVGTTTTATLAIENTGSAAGTLSSFTVTGGAFQTTGLPLLPGTIGAGQTVQISVVYTPTAVQADSGTIQMVLSGQTITINLAGTGISSQLKFQFTSGTQTLPVNLNQVSLPNTSVGSTATVSVTAVNSGNTSATLNGISLTGSGFQLVTAPPFPQTLLPNGSISFTFAFTPPSAGNFTGYLALGGTTLTITAQGLGPLYQYSYTTGSVVNSVSPGGNLFFPTVQLGQTSATTFTITNMGTAPGTISGIYIGEANSPFAITGLPAFPQTLAPNQSVSFRVTFSPTTVASVTGTLHIDGTAFVLAGAGGAPPPFPSYSLSGPQGTLGPLQQPAIGLTLAAPYSLAVTGTLTLVAVPNGFAADPSIQFSTGGKTVAFSIPANTTAAVFANGSNSIELQTGSTSGTITLTPTFQTASGVALTPAASQNLQLVVPASVPLLVGAEVTSQTAAGITLAISGVTNTQNLSELDFTFTAAPGFGVTGGTASVSVSSVAAAFFESAAAQAFGGQFVATIPFSFTSSNKSVTSPSSAVTSVSITAKNAQGTSTPLVVSLP